MSLLEAFKSAASGQEDKAGINMVDVYLANTKDAPNHSKEKKIAEFRNVISAEIGNEEYKWFLLSEVIIKWNLVDAFIADDIRQALADKSKNIEFHIRYQMLRAMGYASGGLVPDDILNEEYLKESAPNFWLELLLIAYQNGNPSTITRHIISLVEGKKPLLTCEALHNMLPEVRRAYGGDIPEFRAQIKEIARSMDSVTDRKDILNAANKIVGGLDSIPEPSTINTDHKKPLEKLRDFFGNINIIEDIIKDDVTHSRREVLPFTHVA